MEKGHPDDDSKIPDFILKLRDKIEKKTKIGLTPDQMYNTDETDVNWRHLPTSMFVTCKAAGAPGRKLEKERIKHS